MKNNRYMFTIDKNTLYHWDIKEKKVLNTWQKKTDDHFTIGLSHDDTKLIMCFANNDISLDIFDISVEGQMTWIRNIRPLDTYFFFEFAPDNKTLIFNGHNGELTAVDLESAEITKKWEAHPTTANWIGFTPDGKYLLTRSTSECKIWKAGTWEELVVIDEKCAIIQTTHRIIQAFLHDGLYKSWSSKIL